MHLVCVKVAACTFCTQKLLLPYITEIEHGTTGLTMDVHSVKWGSPEYLSDLANVRDLLGLGHMLARLFVESCGKSDLANLFNFFACPS